MALIAALMTDPAHRTVLRSLGPAHDVEWAATWRELQRSVRTRPALLAVAALHGRVRRRGARRFRDRYPRTPLILWGDVPPAEHRRLDGIGPTMVIRPEDPGARDRLRELLADLPRHGLPAHLSLRLPHHLADDALALICEAAHRVPQRLRVVDLADERSISVSTLERRCANWGLPTPGRLLLWLRVLHGLYWLLEPARSVESVAGQLGYSSGAAFRRAVGTTLGSRPTALRDERGFGRALDRFLAECPGRAPATAAAAQ